MINRVMNIGIIGCGGVGKAFVALLKAKEAFLEQEKLSLTLRYIIEHNGGVYNPDGIDLSELIEFNKREKELTKFEKFETGVTFDVLMDNGDVDLIVVMTPTNKETGEPGFSCVRRALEKGIHVVTSDKGPVLLAYHSLKREAAQNSAQFCIGCTTGGALPSVNAGMIDLAGADISSIEGVLNGTTNFILDDMKGNGVTYEAALMKAQEAGIAETDPTLDVEGWDTATKLLILTNVLMNENKTLSDISVTGITKLTQEDIKAADQEGKKYRLIGKTQMQDNKLVMSVKPEKLDKTHAFYNVSGKNKAVKYMSDTLGDLTVIGGASGVTPAAASLLRDIININRGYTI